MFIQKHTLNKFKKEESSGTYTDAAGKDCSREASITAAVGAASSSPNSLKTLDHNFEFYQNYKSIQYSQDKIYLLHERNVDLTK